MCVEVGKIVALISMWFCDFVRAHVCVSQGVAEAELEKDLERTFKIFFFGSRDKVIQSTVVEITFVSRNVRLLSSDSTRHLLIQC